MDEAVCIKQVIMSAANMRLAHYYDRFPCFTSSSHVHLPQPHPKLNTRPSSSAIKERHSVQVPLPHHRNYTPDIEKPANLPRNVSAIPFSGGGFQSCHTADDSGKQYIPPPPQSVRKRIQKVTTKAHSYIPEKIITRR